MASKLKNIDLKSASGLIELSHVRERVEDFFQRDGIVMIAASSSRGSIDFTKAQSRRKLSEREKRDRDEYMGSKCDTKDDGRAMGKNSEKSGQLTPLLYKRATWMCPSSELVRTPMQPKRQQVLVFLPPPPTPSSMRNQGITLPPPPPIPLKNHKYYSMTLPSLQYNYRHKIYVAFRNRGNECKSHSQIRKVRL